ncbi:MAG: hypothetical protein Aurels2KO_33200 [Aureliella sp.]
MHDTLKRRSAFRCAVAPEYSKGVLIVGRRKFAINVLDTSRDGYTLRCTAKIAEKFSAGSKARLVFRGETWEIARKSLYNESNDVVHLGCTRIRDLTRTKEPRASIFAALVPQNALSSDPALLMFLLIAFMVACVSLPGLGNQLGTAPRIQKGINTIVKEVRELF